jgi:hypothetical protein
VVLVGWAVLLARFRATFRGAHERSTSAAQLARLIWLLFLFIVLAGTVHHPMVSRWMAGALGAWFARIPRVVFAVGAYIMTARACYGFAPSLRPKRWNWPLLLGLMTITSYIIIVALYELGAASLAQPPDYYWEYVADPLFHYYMLLIALRVVLPALALARKREEQRPMRLRFALMSATHLAVVIWMLNDTLHDLGVVVGYGYDPQPVYRLSILLFASTFLFSYFMPASYFVRIVRLSDYLWNLTFFWPIRALQVVCLHWSGRAVPKINPRRLIADPGTAIYRATIDILDTRKALKLHSSKVAQQLGARLDPAAGPDLSYSQVLDELQWLGWRVMVRRVPLPALQQPSREAHA